MAHLAGNKFMRALSKIVAVLGWSLWFYLSHPILWFLSLAPMILRMALAVFADQIGSVGILILEFATEIFRAVLVGSILAMGLHIPARTLFVGSLWQQQLVKLQHTYKNHRGDLVVLGIGFIVIFALIDRLLGKIMTPDGALSLFEGLAGAISITGEEARMALILMVKNFVVIPIALIYMLRAARIFTER